MHIQHCYFPCKNLTIGVQLDLVILTLDNPTPALSETDVSETNYMDHFVLDLVSFVGHSDSDYDTKISLGNPT